jgi:membrane peptidoglycan carboxypeptidase
LTIDRALQGHLDRTLCAASRDLGVHSVAGVVLDNRRGDVLAESAWSHGAECEFSPAFAGNLQPGSTFKPFAVLAALEQGLSVDLPLLSAPFESSFIKNADGSLWRVRNYAFRYRGEITLARALRFSDNTAFARLTEHLPLNTLQSVYERFGLAKPGEVTPSIVLGALGKGVSLLKIASAYSAIARLGVYVEPRFLRFLHYGDGTTWWAADHKGALVSSYGAVCSLHEVLAATLPDLAPLGFAGKTGTTRRGSLVAAYNDFVSVAVWLGYTRQRAERTSKGLSAVKVLERFVNEALLGHSRDPFSI